MQNNKPQKTFKATYVFGGEWVNNKLINSQNITVNFHLHEIQRYGVKNVIKYYAKRYNIGEDKYNCFIENFGKNSTKNK
jgi:hypothetical protein